MEKCGCTQKEKKIESTIAQKQRVVKLRKMLFVHFVFQLTCSIRRCFVLMKIVALSILMLCCAYYNSMWPYSWIGRSLKCASPI